MRDDELETLLQAGLDSYGKAEPLSGMEDRVLRRVQERHTARRRVWVRWAVATACACLLVAVVEKKGIWPVPPRPAQPVQSATANTGQGQGPIKVVSQTAPQETAKSIVPTLPAEHRGRTADAAARQSRSDEGALPKLDVFPTPQSLTPEERAMLQFVTQDPKAAEEVVTTIRSGSPEQIQIAKIQIEPLEIGGTQQEETNAKDQ